MSPNKRNRILAGVLALAFLMPLLIKTEHLICSDHDHHFQCHACQDTHWHTPDNHCEILEFDYFFFTSAKLRTIPQKIEHSIDLKENRDKDIFRSVLALSYCLRAPPIVEDSLLTSVCS
ncbi:MAG: hypothetical protein ACEPOZ_08035 [Marinifilaceae bacterium]